MSLKDKFRYFIYLHRTGLLVGLLALLLILFPLVEDNPYTLGLTNLIAINAIVVLGLNLFIGYAGQISLGHAAFFGLGAYGSAIATVTFGLSPWLATVCWWLNRPTSGWLVTPMAMVVAIRKRR
jgi:branched-chain amino acid transport system permease protein